MVFSPTVKFLLAAICLFVFICPAQADIVRLKNGKIVEGTIVKQTDKYIKIDFLGTTLTYWADEIDKIEAGKETAPGLVKGENAKGEFSKASDYLREGRWQGAITELSAIISDKPKHTGAHFNLGCAYALTDDYNKAIEEFKKALSLEQKPFTAFCHFNIAGVYFKQAILTREAGLFAKASEHFKQAVDILRNFVLASDYARQTELFSKLKDLSKAKFGLGVLEIGLPPDSAIFLDPDHIMGANENKGYVFDASSVPPLFFFNSPVSHWRVCESKLDIQKPNEISQDAKQCFEAVLDSLAKKSFSSLDDLIKWNAYFLFAQFFIGQGDLDRAIEFVLKAKDVGLNYSIEYKNLATLYLEKGDLVQAKAYAEKALEINPQMPERNTLEDIIKKAQANIPGN